MADFLAELSEDTDITVELLKRKHVYAINDEIDEPIRSWTVYKCLYYETESGDDTYLLSNGKWFRVNTSFLDRVNKSFKDTPVSDLSLPEFTDAREEDYNLRVQAENPELFALMDQVNIYFPDTSSKTEFCDLYTKKKQLLHIKRYAGSSAALSHLFSQGVVSGSLFKREAEYRKMVNGKLPLSHRSVEPEPKPEEFEVVFGIISKSKKPLLLPFFSRINLKNARQRLNELGYKVSLLKIQAIEEPKVSAVSALAK